MKLCCQLDPIIKCCGCKVDMCHTCALEHVVHLSETGWYVLSEDYADAVKFANEVSSTPFKLKTLYVVGE